MKMWKVFRGHSVMTFGLLVTTFAIASIASATPIPPGSPYLPISSISLPAGGTVVASVLDNTVSTTQTGDTLTVTYSEWVYKESDGDLDFIIQAVDDGAATGGYAASNDVIDTVTGSGFAGNGAVTTNVGFDASAPVGSTISGGVDPNQANRQPANGNVVGFSFGTAVATGQQTDYLIIQTNATAYVAGTVSFQDGVTAAGAGFGVAPEPTSVGLLLGGLFGLGLIVTRKFRVQQS